MKQKIPIIISGSHRSGSTWLGKMISFSEKVCYIHEPLNKAHRPEIKYWFPYISDHNESMYRNYLNDVFTYNFHLLKNLFKLRTPRQVKSFYYNLKSSYHSHGKELRPLVKDPLAIFSLEWLFKTYNAQIIVLIRGPLPFVSSLKQLNWTHPFEDFVKQPELLKKFDVDLQKQIMEYAKTKKDVVDQAILLWNSVNGYIYHYYYPKYQNNEKWLFIKHEDISTNPMHYFEQIFSFLNIRFTKKIKNIIEDFTNENNRANAPLDKINVNLNYMRRNSKANLKNWKTRLTQDEIERILSKTKTYRHLFNY